MILVAVAIPTAGRTGGRRHAEGGGQTIWTYSNAADQGGGFEFDSVVIPDSELKPGDIRLLSVGNEAMVPVGNVIHLQVRAG